MMWQELLNDDLILWLLEKHNRPSKWVTLNALRLPKTIAQEG